MVEGKRIETGLGMFGGAGAIDFYAPELGLPAESEHDITKPASLRDWRTHTPPATTAAKSCAVAACAGSARLRRAVLSGLVVRGHMHLPVIAARDPYASSRLDTLVDPSVRGLCAAQ